MITPQKILLNWPGGFSQGADKSRVILRHPSGEVEELDVQGFSQSGSNVISPGDEILVLPAVDLKSMQYTMDLVQVIYQLALSAGVVLAL